MGDKKRSVMNKWKRTLIAAALTASVILALPVWNVGRAQAAGTDPLDLTRDRNLTVQHLVENAEGLKVTVDLYKVASVDESFTGYDGYKLNLGDAYADLEDDFEKAQNPGKDESANTLYKNLAQKVAKIALGQNGKPAQTTPIHATFQPGSEKAEAAFEKLEAGMYLVVARDADLTDVSKYVTKVGPEPEEGKEDTRDIVTIAYNNQYVYRYTPELIALPMRANALTDGSFNTADRTEWRYDVTVNLKAETVLRHASLEIIKNLDKAPLTTDSCVFEITAVLNGETLLHTYKSVSFGPTDGLHKKITLSNLIPVGSTVTVTEVESGASYTIKDGESPDRTFEAQPDTVDDSDVVTAIGNTVTFNNDRRDSGSGSGAITNNFKYIKDENTGNDSWTWGKDPGLSSLNRPTT